MRISFFEEFPTKQNLDKIKHIDFPTKLYIASKSYKEFQNLEITSKNVKSKIYWPVLKQKEGYWLSPFTKRKALKRVMKELKDPNVPVMWDAELPVHKNKSLFFTELPLFFSNRKLIRDFMDSRKEAYGAEYFSVGKSRLFLYFLGITFNSKNYHPIKMVYSSMHDIGETLIRAEIKSLKKEFGNRLCIGLGVTAIGILGNEPIISLKLLERDLKICKDLGVEEVIIFRLGGINKSYAKLLKKYIK
jgi:hypothetical protein